MTLVIDRHNAVDQNIINPFRILGHVGITVIAVQGLPVEDDDIRVISNLQRTAFLDAEANSRLHRDVMNQFLHCDLVLIARQIADDKTVIHRIRRHLNIHSSRNSLIYRR